MMEEAVDCETSPAEDLLGQGVAGLSLADMCLPGISRRPALAGIRNQEALQHAQSFFLHGAARRSGAD
jgi:hypothetical protein